MRSPQSLLRVGVIGVGHLGYHHARLLATIPDVTLVGVVDVDGSKAAKAAAEFSTSSFKTVNALLDAGVDAASVVVPTSAHLDVAKQLIESGVHVLVEKPLARSTAEARALVKAAREHNVILQVGHIERFNGAVVALREAVKRPLFIECHRMSPFSQRGDDVSVVHDLMIHDLDIVRWFESSDVVWLDAVGVPVFSKSEDIANVRIRFASGCVANLTASRVSVEKMRKIRIFEENAYVSTDYSEQEVLIYRKKRGTPSPGASPMEQIQIESLPVQREEPLKAELSAFVGCVLSGRPPAVSGEDGVAALELAERIVAFIHENTPLEGSTV